MIKQFIKSPFRLFCFKHLTYEPLRLDFVRARVVKEYNATSWAELTLRQDEIILIMSQQDDEENNFARKGWLCGECGGCRGWFPIE